MILENVQYKEACIMLIVIYFLLITAFYCFYKGLMVEGDLRLQKKKK